MAIKKWLEEFWEIYLRAIAPLKDTPEDREKAKQWANWMKQQWVARDLKELKQQKVPMNDTRNAIKAIDPNHIALEYMNFTTAEWTIVNQPTEKKVESRNENCQLIDDPQAIVDKATELLDSREWSDIAAGLAVLTGRRSSEILQTAQFTYKTPYSVIFTGALKRRGEAHILSFEIPTLALANKVIEASYQVRERVDTTGMTNREVNDKYGVAVVRACERHFSELVPVRSGKDNLYTHLFRCIYARIATHWYAPPTVSDIEYMATIMGHYQVLDESNPELRRTLVSSRHYNDYRIGDGLGNIDGRQGIKLGEPNVYLLEVFQPKDFDTATTNTATDIAMTEESTTETTAVTTAPTGASKEEFVRVATSLLDANNVAAKLAGLMALTGRKASEIIKSGTFHLTKDEYTLSFSNKLAHNSETISTLIAADKTLNAINQLRTHQVVKKKRWRYLPPSEIEQRTESVVTTQVEKHLSGIISNLTGAGLIAAYEYYIQSTQASATTQTDVEQGFVVTESTPNVEEIATTSTANTEQVTAKETTVDNMSASPTEANVTPTLVKVPCYQYDRARLEALAQQLGTTNQQDTLAAILNLAEAALAQQYQEQQVSVSAVQAQPTVSEGLVKPEEKLESQLPAIQPSSLQSDQALAQLSLAVASLTQRLIQQQEQLEQLRHNIASAPVTASSGKRQSIKAKNSSFVATNGNTNNTEPLTRTARSQNAQAKVHAAIDAIMQYNSLPERTHSEKWLISQSVLKKLTKVYQGVIQDVVVERAFEIEQHHKLHGLGEFHNNAKGKRGEDISQALGWTEKTVKESF